MTQAGNGLLRPLVALAIALSLTSAANAHDPRPLTVEVTASGSSARVKWKTPSSIDFSARPTVFLAEPCTPAGELIERRLSDSFAGERAYDCAAGIGGAQIRIAYPGANPSLATFVRVLRDGESDRVLLQPGETSWEVPRAAGNAGSASSYLRLGVEHILVGVDHLLFLICLMLVARGPKRVLIAVTGFTLAHSVTLALATFGVVTVPVIFVEAMIALSIVFMAAEIVRNDRTTLTWRYPGSIAFVFGLLHGFGFANVLAHIGLPQGQAAAALFLFNVGVELGQIAFLAALFATSLLLRRVLVGSAVEKLHWRPVAVASGTVAAFWTVERIAGFW